MGLELYAKIEELLGFEDEIESLYEFYIGILRSWQPASLVDIGCGGGAFLLKAADALSLKRAYGIDLSETMVEKARSAGVEADAMDVCDVESRFDAATAVFDVLNYLDKEELAKFLGCVRSVLVPGGIFVGDINTRFGFEEIAPGSLVRSDERRCLALDSRFEGERLETVIDYFERSGEQCYKRERDRVVQYYHDIESLASACEGLELIQTFPLTMYADEPDKEVLLFKRV
ncbi:class I SAM-dependent methyltransferase [Hydrogenimonas urashimensis]|uniref:class I SAM-dependent methyltransferase n=1 Tax=Hydrogenimonas urashimensis TaxID=2740515 RepID=UPI00191677D0|nr:class I SAM-dependent methyltransferase [Hydrogenimonas urashimensis]